MAKKTSNSSAAKKTSNSSATKKTSNSSAAKKTSNSSATKKTSSSSVTKIISKQKQRISPHKSFRRSYKEDYQRGLEVPGIMQHILMTFKIIFQNWKLFLPLLIITVILYIALVGILDESTYKNIQNIFNQASAESSGNSLSSFAKAGLVLISTVTTGGLSGSSSEVAAVFGVLIFLLVWLTTIFLLRHTMAGHKVKLRDGLYNSMTPLVSTFVVLAVAAIQTIPILLLIIAYSAAVQTDFLATPFYALLFFVFALLMLLISGYLLSSSIIALVAVSAPGLYPIRALVTASELMMSRRIKFIIRLIAMIITLALIWIIIMLPLIMFDFWMKSFAWTAGIPFIPFCLAILICFTMIYITTYLYLYYRWMINYEEK